MYSVLVGGGLAQLIVDISKKNIASRRMSRTQELKLMSLRFPRSDKSWGNYMDYREEI